MRGVPDPTNQLQAPLEQQRTDRIGALTTLRFVAALLVVLYHTLPRTGGDLWYERLAASVVNLGFSAVGLFFVLSGFILSTVYPKLPDRASIVRFALARVARIYPMYALSLLMDMPRLLAWRITKSGLFAGSLIATAQLGGQLAMLQAWFPPIGGLNFPSWSVATEAFFYLFFPLLLPALTKVKGLAANFALFGAFAITGIALALTASLLFAPALMPDWLDVLIGHNPVSRLPEFAAGIVLANLNRSSPQSTSSQLITTWRPLALAIGLGGYFMIVLLEHEIRGSALQNAVFVPFYGLLILGLALPTGHLAWLMSQPPLLLLGEASYALYLIHIPGWTAFSSWGGNANSSEYWLYIVGIIVASILVHVAFERPMRRLILARLSGPHC
jgi:peptidoglycan/LPS O-acetylase OafA/YrhL